MKFINRALEFCLYAFAFLLPLQTRYFLRSGMINFGYWEYGTYSIYLTDILLIVILSLFAVKIAQERDDNYFTLKLRRPAGKFSAGLYWLMALEFLVFISVFFSYNKILGIYRYGVFLLGLGIFFVSKNRGLYDRLKLIYAFLAGIFLQVILGIYQFVSQSTFANKYLGLAVHDPSQSGTSVIEIFSHGLTWRYLRAYGGLDHPNMLGALTAAGILLIAGLLLKKPELKIKKQNLKLFLIVNYALLFFIGAGLLVSFSRSAWLAALIGLLIIGAVHFKKIFFTRLSFKSLQVKMVAIVSLLFIIIIAILFNVIEVRFDQQNRLEKISTTERLDSFGEGWAIIKTHPLFGSGIGNYTIALFEKDPRRASYDYQPVHNTFLLVWAELGFLGLLAFLGFLGAVIWEKLRQPRVHETGLAIMAALLVVMMVDHWLWSLHFGIFLLWFLLGLTWPEENGTFRD